MWADFMSLDRHWSLESNKINGHQNETQKNKIQANE